MHTLALTFAVVAAQVAPTIEKEEPVIPWATRSSFFIGARSGLAIPPGSKSIAPSVSIEFGVAPPTGFGIGMRAIWMNSPPSVPFLGIPDAKFGFGALADFRYYIETVDPLIIYPTIAVGFLAGPDVRTGSNVVLPLFNPGLGAKLKFGNFYFAFEFGVSGLTIPFMGLCVGYEADSKLDKANKLAAQRAAATPIAAVSAPAPVAAPVTPTPAAPAN